MSNFLVYVFGGSKAGSFIEADTQAEVNSLITANGGQTQAMDATGADFKALPVVGEQKAVVAAVRKLMPSIVRAVSSPVGVLMVGQSITLVMQNDKNEVLPAKFWCEDGLVEVNSATGEITARAAGSSVVYAWSAGYEPHRYVIEVAPNATGSGTPVPSSGKPFWVLDGADLVVAIGNPNLSSLATLDTFADLGSSDVDASNINAVREFLGLQETGAFADEAALVAAITAFLGASDSAPSFTLNPASFYVKEGESAVISFGVTNTQASDVVVQKRNAGSVGWEDQSLTVSSIDTDKYTVEIPSTVKGDADFRIIAASGDGILSGSAIFTQYVSSIYATNQMEAPMSTFSAKQADEGSTESDEPEAKEDAAIVELVKDPESITTAQLTDAGVTGVTSQKLRKVKDALLAADPKPVNLEQLQDLVDAALA